MMLAKLKVGRRLGLGFGMLLTLLVGIAVVGFSSMESLNDKVKVIGQANFPRLMLAQDLSEAEYRMARDIRTLVIVSDPEIIRSVKGDVEQARHDFQRAWDELDKHALSEEGRALLSRI